MRKLLLCIVLINIQLFIYSQSTIGDINNTSFNALKVLDFFKKDKKTDNTYKIYKELYNQLAGIDPNFYEITKFEIDYTSDYLNDGYSVIGKYRVWYRKTTAWCNCESYGY